MKKAVCTVLIVFVASVFLFPLTIFASNQTDEYLPDTGVRQLVNQETIETVDGVFIKEVYITILSVQKSLTKSEPEYYGSGVMEMVIHRNDFTGEKIQVNTNFDYWYSPRLGSSGISSASTSSVGVNTIGLIELVNHFCTINGNVVTTTVSSRSGVSYFSRVQSAVVSSDGTISYRPY